VQDIPCCNTIQGTNILLKGDGVCIALLALRWGRILDSIQEGIMRKNVDYKHDGGCFVWRGDRVL
jgi:hypothetical protein